MPTHPLVFFVFGGLCASYPGRFNIGAATDWAAEHPEDGPHPATPRVT